MKKLLTGIFCLILSTTLSAQNTNLEAENQVTTTDVVFKSGNSIYLKNVKSKNTAIKIKKLQNMAASYNIKDAAIYNSKRKYQIDKSIGQVQMIFQDPYSSLNSEMSIGNSIIEPMISHQVFNSKNEMKFRALELLNQVGLSESDYNKFPNQFSGGQRQRIVIARALALNPEIIICDESVSALDVSVQAQVLNLLRELQQKRNLTYLFISHDLSVVKFMSDDMIVMKNGQVMESGNAEEIYKNPRSEYTRELLDAIPKSTLSG